MSRAHLGMAMETYYRMGNGQVFILNMIVSFNGSYLPPEFFLHGTVDEKTDVYAYGVLLLELISGRPAIDEHNKSVVMWVSWSIQMHLYAVADSD